MRGARSSRPGPCAAPPDPALLAEGWVRRQVAGPDRAREVIDLYASLGFEVRVRLLAAADLGPGCRACALAPGGDHVVIYTRRGEAAPPGDRTRSSAVSATTCLREEHEVILKVLDCFEFAVRRARECGVVSGEVFEPFVEFFRGFADRCHHCKEEDRLFPRLEARGVAREGGPIGVMLHEHRLGREHVRAIAAALGAADGGDAAAAATVLEHAEQFLDLLRGHIQKENHVLFSMADQLIQGDDLTELDGAYRAAESEAGCCERMTRCRAVAEELIQAYDPSGGA